MQKRVKRKVVEVSPTDRLYQHQRDTM